MGDLHRTSLLIEASIREVQHAHDQQIEALLRDLSTATQANQVWSAVQQLQYLLSRYPDDRFIIAQAHLDVLGSALCEEHEG